MVDSDANPFTFSDSFSINFMIDSLKCSETSLSKYSDILKYKTRLKPSPSLSPSNIAAG
uniref:Uncharacterized protein n=1 Tax=Arundo donax TaxID=35708 RepID=A0A0A9DWC6_ARUDO